MTTTEAAAPSSRTKQVIGAAAAALGPGSLKESAVGEHLHPLFARVLARGGIYLANHSLGRPLDRTADDVAEALDLWYSDMDAAWGPWLAEMDAFRARQAAIIGWPRPDAVVPRTSAAQGLRAVLNALPTTRPRIVATTGEFDSIDFNLRSWAARGRAEVSWVGPGEGGLFHGEAVATAITPETDLVVVSLVFYATGQMLEDIGTVVERAHACGALVLVDGYHASGAIVIPEAAREADFMVGGSYKYARGGTGACWLAVHPRHLGESPALVTLDTGWFARREPFGFSRDGSVERASGGDAWLESTPSVLPFYQARAGQELLLAVGVKRLSAYNRQQQGFLADALRGAGVEVWLIEPRGAFVLVPTGDVKGDVQRLAEAGVIADGRPSPSGVGGFVRLCPGLLNTREEMAEAARRIGRVMGGGVSDAWTIA
jgi:kynureninase